MSDDDAAVFADLGLREELLAALSGLGYEAPTPIQREAIPHLLSGRDVLAQAATGTGKTAAFALPVLQSLADSAAGGVPRALVLVPTRELCVQVSEAVHRYARGLDVRVLPIYGGQPIGRQLRELERGVDVVVATPGRAVDHVNRGTLALRDIGTVVLDEADEMLDMGFADDLDAILGATPVGRQTVLFSATLPSRIDRIARKHLRDPIRVEIERASAASGEPPAVRQCAYVVARAHKTAALGRILDIEAPAATLVFARTRDEVDRLTESLNGRGYRAEALHGGMDQAQRERVLGRLRSGAADLIVATDVAARGLDVDSLTHVVNYDVPSAAETYVHRIGRVGRAGRSGVAITLAEPREHRMLKAIERLTGNRIAVETVPSMAELHERRLDLTRAAIEERLVDGDLDGYRVVLESLTDDYDVVEVALAAVRLAHEERGGTVPDDDIPAAPVADGPERRKAKPRASSGKGAGTGDRGPSDHPTARVQVNLGREAGIRPQDLVGAIANETGIKGKRIGVVEIADRYSIVEIPLGRAASVVEALGATRLRGRKAKARILPGERASRDPASRQRRG